MPLTSRLNKILIYSREEAERLQNPTIEPEHLLLGIFRLHEGTAFDLLVRAGCEINDAKLHLDEAMFHAQSDTMFAEITRSTDVERILRIAENEARQYNAEAVGSIHLLLAILHERVNSAAAYLESTWAISYDKIVELYPKQQTIPRGGAGQSNDVEDAPRNNASQSERKSHERRNASATPSLDKYGRDLTKQAAESRLDPVIGRDSEIERVTQILSRRKKNNPILIGEPGVGKSAIVEGLALRIVNHETEALKDKRIICLDVASMVAGTTYRGQFEERMKSVLQELQTHPEIILFIDEIHTIIGAGNAQGSLDAANILKPALARGEIQCIGATTTNEYRLSIEKDGALERRFQKIMVRPTTTDETLAILQQLSSYYADFHRVTYLPEALEACVALADRYITDRAFPDKAIDILDESGARKHSLQVANDPRQIITPDDVAAVVATMSGVPVTRVRKDETERLRTLGDALRNKVVGQDEAVTTVVKAIQRSRLGLRDPRRPIGTFFFLGPTGVGKTYLAQCLAEEMFGSKDAVIRFDMSEYMEKHTVSLLVGAPPGYVAHEDGGKLTEAVRRKPYSILLFDEIEKAHPDIFNVLLQLLDEGRLTDRSGHVVDFKNTIIILTSNVGTRRLKDFGAGIGFDAAEPDVKARRHTLMNALDKTFPPEFVNRIDNVIVFEALDKDSLGQILDLEIKALQKRLKQQGHRLIVSQEAKNKMLEQADTKQFGARPIKRAVQTFLEDKITAKLLINPKIKNIKI